MGWGLFTWRAQEGLERLVAIKMLPQGAEAERTMQRFQTEAEVIARLQHPNLIQIYEVGTVDGQAVFLDGICAGRHAGGAASSSAAGAARSGAAHPDPGDRHARGPSLRRRASGSKTGEYSAEARGRWNGRRDAGEWRVARHGGGGSGVVLSQDHGFRVGKAAGRGRRADAHAQRSGHTVLHGTRAGAGRFEET